MIEVILAWIKRREIRGGDFPGFHFWWPEASRWQQLYLCHIPSGLRFPRAAWIVPPRPCLATTEWPRAKQVGRGFRGIVRFQEKCRLDERGISASAATRSVIRQTTIRLRYVTFGRLRFAYLPYGFATRVSVLIQTEEVIR